MTAIDTTTPSLTIVKEFPYRGSQEEWSNTYFMTGDTPPDAAHWKTLADAVIAQEKTILLTTTDIIRAVGHEPGESVAVWGYDYAAASEEVAGTFALPSGSTEGGGDSAWWLRWSTDQRTSKGKPIFLRNYYHPGIANGPSSTTRDELDDDLEALAQTYGNHWITGFSDGTETHGRAGPHGVVGLVALPGPYVTTRTLIRRGRRP